MLNMVICEASHRIIAMIIIWLVPDLHARDAGVSGGFLEVLWEELALLVEVVSGSLHPHGLAFAHG